jgi:hypothetical protein
MLPAQERLPTSGPLALHLTLPRDSIRWNDTLSAALQIVNLTDDTLSLCATESMFVIRGPRGAVGLAEFVTHNPCVRTFHLLPRAEHAWHEPIVLDSANASIAPGALTIRKQMRVRFPSCNTANCVVRLQSEGRPVTLHAFGGRVEGAMPPPNPAHEAVRRVRSKGTRRVVRLAAYALRAG